jgi:hypothetical protein
MKVLLNSILKVESTKNQWIISKKVSETRWLPMMFFSKLENLCEALLELKLRENQAGDIKDIIEEIKVFKTWLNQSRLLEQMEKNQ